MPDDQVGQGSPPVIGDGKPAGAAPEKPAPTAPPEGMVPIAALQGEQKVAKEAREQADRMKVAMQLYGFQVGDDGTIAPPARQEPGYTPPVPTGGGHVQVPAQVSALANRLGVDANELMDAFGAAAMPVAMGYAGQIGEGMAAMSEANLQRDDPYWSVYADEYKTIMKTLVPPHLRGNPQTVNYVRDIARGRKTVEIAQKMAESGGASGTVVGRFTERAAPGAGGPQAQLPPDVDSLATAWGLTPEQKARVAERRARREK